jgi:hypothetical protein
MPPRLAGSDTTGATGLFETLTARHQYLPPLRDLRPLRAMGLPAAFAATATTTTFTNCGFKVTHLLFSSFECVRVKRRTTSGLLILHANAR